MIKRLLIGFTAAALAVPGAQAAADRVVGPDGGSIARASSPVNMRVSDAKSAAACDEQCRADIERAREETEKYRNVATAIGDGFVETMGCEATAAGGVGIRYLNAQRYDERLDLTAPEFLLYMPEGFDSVARRLVAVGYALPAPLGSPGPAPVLFGQRFSGPVPGRGPLEPSHYELVVWLHSENRDGTFAGANPFEACDASSVLASPDAGSAEGCFEVLGVFSAPAERVRRLGRIPEQFRLRGEEGGSAQLMLSTFHCATVTVAGAGRETMFAELVALLDPPDYVERDDPCCSRYLLQEVANNADVVQWIQERGGLGPDVIAYSPELARSFDPLLCTADPDYSFTTPEYEFRAATACHGPVDAPTSVRFWHESPGGMTELHFWAPIRFAAAEVQVEARPGTLLTELLGTSEPVRADPGSLSVSWERGVLQINRTVGVPTAATVRGFTAQRAADGTVVRWQTASESGVLG